MPTLLLNGIVTSCTDYRDNDRILTLFTFERGRIDAKARNCRKPTAPLVACAQPFAFAEYELFYNRGRYTVNQYELKESFFALREDVERFSLASVATRLCQEAVQQEQPNEELFSLLYHTLSFLTYGDCAPSDILLCFLLRFLDIIGYCPTITRCAGCGRDLRQEARIYFSAARGGAVCPGCCQHDRQISKTALEAMRRILLKKDPELAEVRMKDELNREIGTALVRYLEHIFGADNRATVFLRQKY
ncbi:MAG: DNA repair protein RecO [Clostridia bacterium]|nr:DNA repair protein RecO [Clostridia bacterium]